MYKVKSLEKELNKLIAPALAEFGFHNLQLIRDWDKIVGADLARLCQPFKISYSSPEKKETILTIEVFSSASSTALFFKKEVIIDKIASFFGFKLIHDIKLIHSPKKIEPKPEPKRVKSLTKEQENIILNEVKDINDEELKQVLFNLGKEIISS